MHARFEGSPAEPGIRHGLHGNAAHHRVVEREIEDGSEFPDIAPGNLDMQQRRADPGLFPKNPKAQPETRVRGGSAQETPFARPTDRSLERVRVAAVLLEAIEGSPACWCRESKSAGQWGAVASIPL